jgi:outer membrane protein assembly factor BamD (BamD/ComL family)
MTEPKMKRVSIGIYILGGMCALTGLGVGIYTADAAADPAWNESGNGAILVGLGFLCAILGFTSAILAGTLAAWLEKMSAGGLPRSGGPLGDAAMSSASGSSESAEAMEASLAALSRQVSEINELLLLSDQERAARRSRLEQEEVESLAGEVEAAVATQLFAEADTALEAFCQRQPHDDRIPVLRERIATGRASARTEAVREAMQEATNLISAERFDEAHQLAEQLQQDHPDVPEAETLLSRVQRESAGYATQQRQRLVELVQEHGQARQWALALKAAHRLIERYRTSPEADTVRTMMPTLVDNARIEEVRNQRDRFVEMMKRHRYDDAIAIARGIIEDYPETQAAEELRRELPRLLQLAGPQ